MPGKPVDLEAVVQPHATVADKIRALSAAGVPRADIARFLGKRYQHVRNVLEGDAQAGGGYVLGRADLSGVAENGAAYRVDEDPTEIDRRSSGVFWLRVRQDGCLPLAPEMIEALGARPGRRVFAELKDGALTLVSADTAAARARASVRSRVKAGSNVVDEFLAERRAAWGEDDD